VKECFNLELKDIMTKNVESVERNTTIQEAAKMMKQYNVGSIPVCDGDKLVGIVTDRDIVLRGIADGKEIAKVTCSQVMSSDMTTGTPNMDVHVAAKIMADKQVRRLPVVDNGKLAGIVALGDLAVESKFVNEAGDALNDISKPTTHMM
jgi:CBS domain-containing protein